MWRTMHYAPNNFEQNNFTGYLRHVKGCSVPAAAAAHCHSSNWRRICFETTKSHVSLPAFSSSREAFTTRCALAVDCRMRRAASVVAILVNVTAKDRNFIVIARVQKFEIFNLKKFRRTLVSVKRFFGQPYFLNFRVCAFFWVLAPACRSLPRGPDLCAAYGPQVPGNDEAVHNFALFQVGSIET